MFHQALGSGNLVNRLAATQMITFTVFVVFYVPCQVTLAALTARLPATIMLG